MTGAIQCHLGERNDFSLKLRGVKSMLHEDQIQSSTSDTKVQMQTATKGEIQMHHLRNLLMAASRGVFWNLLNLCL